MKKISILGLAGSLRRGSYNKSILRAAAELLPGNATMEIYDLDGLPLFNQDNEDKPTAKVREFKAKLRAADAILIATPEYNYSIPGVLKNAIDVASRPYSENAFDGKLVAIMGASIGMLGSARAQYHLRQCFIFLNVHTLNDPEVMVPHVSDKVDKDGRLVDKNTREHIAGLVDAIVEQALKMKSEEKMAKAA